MRKIIETAAFGRDLKKCRKRGKDILKLFKVVESLAIGSPLDPKHKLHRLKGDWKPKWDCHIEPDWILIFEVTDKEIILVRTGTHSDLFE